MTVVNQPIPSKFWEPKMLLSLSLHVYMVLGERSNGKTYAFLKECLNDYLKNNKEMAYIRHTEGQIKEVGPDLFAPLIRDGILKCSGYDNIVYVDSTKSWFLEYWDEELEKVVRKPEAFCRGFTLNNAYKRKGKNTYSISNVFFDEFIDPENATFDDAKKLANIVSTIARDRGDVRILMAANTVNWDCPFFRSWNMIDVDQIKAGEIKEYEIIENVPNELSGIRKPRVLKIGIERTNPGVLSPMGRPSDVYSLMAGEETFQMMVNGGWETGSYYNKPCAFKQKDVIFRFYIIYAGKACECEIVNYEKNKFVYISDRRLDNIKEIENALVYSSDPSYKRNFRRFINDDLKISKRILKFFNLDQVYYENNQVGQTVTNYLRFCKQFSILKH